MTENLAPVSGNAHSTSDLLNFSKNLACPACAPHPKPPKCCCKQWSEEVAAVFFAFPAFNYTAAISKQDVF